MDVRRVYGGSRRGGPIVAPTRSAGPCRRRRSSAAGATSAVLLVAGLAAACGSGTVGASPVRDKPIPGVAPVHPDVASGQWTTYAGNFSRTADDTADPSLDPLARAWTSRTLDGSVWGEALVYGGRVYVGTENDTVYALSAATGAVVWSRHLATPVPSGDLPCGDIGPVVGITSTLVIDPSRQEIFASGASLSAGQAHHDVFGLDVGTGRLLFTRDVDQPGWDPLAQLQRTGLALDGGRVVLGFGGNYGDCGNYHGWVVGVPETGAGGLLAYEVPTSREGAVWATSGVSVDSAGHILLATGNGANGPGKPFDHGDSVIELSPSFRELQYFAPTSWAQDNASDGDLGSTAPVILGNGEIFQVGKQSTAYLLDASRLGGIGGQVASAGVCFATGGNAYAAPYAYVGCLGHGVTQVRVGPGARLSVGWTTPTGIGGPPTVAGGLVWSIDQDSNVLVGLDPATGRAKVSVSIPPVEHFAAASAGEGLLVVPGVDAVTAFVGPSGIRHSSSVVGIARTPDDRGYWLAGSAGGVFPHGAAVSHGSAASLHLAASIVGIARTRDAGGYWLAGSDGGVFSYGDARFHGSAGGERLAATIVGIAATPDGGGYWLVGSDGGVFTYGDGRYHGSAASLHLAAPIVGITPTPDGRGYWLVGSDGGVFTYGDARYHGSAGGEHLAARIAGIAASPDGMGYWLVGGDGGVFTYGDARYRGSAAGRRLGGPVVAIAPTNDGKGYRLAGAGGAVLDYGDAP